MTARSRFSWTVTGALVAVVTFTGFLLVTSGTTRAKLASDLLLEAAALLAAWSCACAARRTESE